MKWGFVSERAFIFPLSFARIVLTAKRGIAFTFLSPLRLEYYIIANTQMLNVKPIIHCATPGPI